MCALISKIRRGFTTCNFQSHVMRRFNQSEIRSVIKSQLSKSVDQRLVEKWSASFWSSTNCKDGGKRPFVVMFPPPNITGNLHLGHALTAALQDALIRHRRMQGDKTLWIPGFDHAGLATQGIVERLIWHREGVTRQEFGKDKFNEAANQWKDLKRTEMRDQLNRLGLTLNHDREYFTLDENSSRAVQAAFIRLFRKGLIYRSVKPVFWSEKLQSTLSDIEVENVDGVDKYTRTGEVVERRLIPQWFVNAKDMAYKAVEVVNNSSIDMIPPNYKHSYSAWLVENGVKDWCISRQSWWGHPIPAYRLAKSSDTQESWISACSQQEAQSLLGDSDSVVQDSDVLDTWFSSSLLPLTISGWPDNDRFERSCAEGLFPLNIMETGFDILNYWVSKMVMMSLALEDKIPFKLILLHGMICDSTGKKMSKSKGNVIDPIDVIDGAQLSELQQRTRDSHAQGILDDKQLEPVLKNQQKLFPRGIAECGADGLRAYLLSHDIQEEVVRIQIAQIEKVRRLANKIWNVYRFIIAILEGIRDSNGTPQKLKFSDYHITQLDHRKLSEVDQQVLRELAICVQTADESFTKTYQLHKSFSQQELFWTQHLSNTYISKVRSSLSSHSSYELKVLLTCLVTSTRLLHPIMPHITEYLHQKLMCTFEEDQLSETLCYCEYPRLEDWFRYLTELKKEEV